MNYNECINELEKLYTKSYNLDLKNIISLLERIDNPHKNIKIIHVAGTNGKGSVCAIISSILKEAGYKVGMYTSPHLKKLNERFKIDNIDIADDEFAEYFSRVFEKQKDETYFELITATAFLYFKEKKVDYLVLEVGLGGRLDATNVVTPIISVITNISLEHQQYLGDTIEKITYEKAGIIKKNIPVVTAAKTSSLKIISDIAKEKNSKLILVKDYIKTNGNFDINGHKNLHLNLKGDFQMENAATALSVIDNLEVKFSEKNIKKGLENAKWPGRFEIKNDLILDCAHNVGGALTLSKEIKKIKKEPKTTIIGILNDKDKKKMVEIFSDFSNNIIFTKPNSYRAADPKELATFTDKPFEIIENVNDAIKKAKKNKGLIVVCGSIYTVGQILDAN